LKRTERVKRLSISVCGDLTVAALCIVGLVSLGCTSRSATFFSCTACLADDAARCATHTPQCGDSSERFASDAGATHVLRNTLGPTELARRPTLEGYKPSPMVEKRLLRVARRCVHALVHARPHGV